MSNVKTHQRKTSAGGTTTVTEHDRSKARRLYAVIADFEKREFKVVKRAEGRKFASEFELMNWTSNGLNGCPGINLTSGTKGFYESENGKSGYPRGFTEDEAKQAVEYLKQLPPEKYKDQY